MPIEPKLLTHGELRGISGHIWISDLPPAHQWTNAVQVLCRDVELLLGHVAALDAQKEEAMQLAEQGADELRAWVDTGKRVVATIDRIAAERAELRAALAEVLHEYAVVQRWAADHGAFFASRESYHQWEALTHGGES